MKKITFLLLSVLLIASLAFGCSSSKSESPANQAQDTVNSAAEKPADAPSAKSKYGYSSDSVGTEAAPNQASAEAKSGTDTNNAADTTRALASDPSRKMIWNGETQLETTDFDSAVNSLYSLINECGGYIQSSAITGEGRNNAGEARLRNARYTVRIPSDNFQLFIKGSGNVATVISSSTSAEDVTSEYFDTEARTKVLKVKEERLIEMLKETKDAKYADQLQYILQIENELSNVRYEIESLTGTLKRYDNLISYSTVTINLNEVKKLTATPVKPETIGQRISQRFTASLLAVIDAGSDFVVWFIGSLPVLIVLAIVVLIVVFAVRKAKKRGSKKLPPPPPEM